MEGLYEVTEGRIVNQEADSSITKGEVGDVLASKEYSGECLEGNGCSKQES